MSLFSNALYMDASSGGRSVSKGKIRLSGIDGMISQGECLYWPEVISPLVGLERRAERLRVAERGKLSRPRRILSIT